MQFSGQFIPLKKQLLCLLKGRGTAQNRKFAFPGLLPTGYRATVLSNMPICAGTVPWRVPCPMIHLTMPPHDAAGTCITATDDCRFHAGRCGLAASSSSSGLGPLVPPNCLSKPVTFSSLISSSPPNS